jgi:hypothetical protein
MRFLKIIRARRAQKFLLNEGTIQKISAQR